METHVLAGGDLVRVINAMIAANKANIELTWKNATAIASLLQSEAPNGALRSSLDAGEESLRDAQAELHNLPTNPFTDSLFQLGDALREMLDQFRV